MKRIPSLLIVAVILLLSVVSCADRSPTELPTTQPSPTLHPSATPSPTQDRSILAEAWSALDESDPATAERLAREFLELEPESAEALTVLAASLGALQEYDESLAALDAVDLQSVTDGQTLTSMLFTYVNLARSSFQLTFVLDAVGRAEDVANLLEELAPGIASRSLPIFLLTAEANLANDMSAVSEEAFPHYQAAEAYFDEQDYENAIEEYDLALAASPNFMIAQIYKADAYFELGDYAAAIQILDELLVNQPDLIQAWQFLGHSYEMLGLWHRARIAYISALMLDSSDSFTNAAFERLGEKYGQWTNYHITECDFDLMLPPDLILEPISLDSQNAPSEMEGGYGLQSPEYSLLFTFIWQPSAQEGDPEAFLQETLAGWLSQLVGAQLIGEPYPFAYSEDYILLQELSYKPEGASNTNASSQAVWICGSTLYSLQVSVPDVDFDSLHLITNAVLGNVFCR
jgi:tetratricopeptide (TPR) repeat protein